METRCIVVLKKEEGRKGRVEREKYRSGWRRDGATNRRHTTRRFKRLESANTLLERFVNTHVHTRTHTYTHTHI